MLPRKSTPIGQIASLCRYHCSRDMSNMLCVGLSLSLRHSGTTPTIPQYILDMLSLTVTGQAEVELNPQVASAEKYISGLLPLPRMHWVATEVRLAGVVSCFGTQTKPRCGFRGWIEMVCNVPRCLIMHAVVHYNAKLVFDSRSLVLSANRIQRVDHARANFMHVADYMYLKCY